MCDFCNKESFESFDEAVEHEKTCEERYATIQIKHPSRFTGDIEHALEIKGKTLAFDADTIIFVFAQKIHMAANALFSPSHKCTYSDWLNILSW